jgi:signal transduction histidine kinase
VETAVVDEPEAVTGPRPKPRGDGAGDCPNRWIQVRVADQGPGVPAEIRGQIFRPFVSTKASSTGFGLALARRAVEAHDGRIDLAVGSGRGPSDEAGTDGGGATFVVELPLTPEADPDAKSKRREPATDEEASTRALEITS